MSERERFERKFFHRNLSRAGGKYEDEGTQCAWEAWQAAKADSAAENERLRKEIAFGIAECEHVAIAGSDDNVREGISRVCMWLEQAREALAATEGTDGQTDPRQKAINDLVALKERFGRLGLYETMQALEPAVTRCGYELADKIAPPTEQEGSSDE